MPYTPQNPERIPALESELATVLAALEAATEAVRADLDCRDWSADPDLMAEYKRLFHKQAQLSRLISYHKKVAK